ncbi:MAG TPA: hypothetical protein VGA78_12415 [Gemmatimonadales bacterium]|jgi:hypothetical protein
MTRHTRFYLGTCAALLGACSEADPLDPSDSATLNADIAAAVADGVGEDVQTMRELSQGLRFGVMFLSSSAQSPPGGCPYDAASGWHDCEPVELPNGLTIDRQYAFYNAAGAPMENFDAEQTASIRAQRVVDGDIERETEHGSLAASVHHERDFTVSGLQGDEQKRTWNGTGSSDISRTRVSDEHGTRIYELSADVTVSNVEVPRHNNTDRDPWPLSGTITKQVEGSVTKDGETRSFERTVVITFNGTQFATATVTGADGTETFEIDLANRNAGRHRP